MKQTAKRFSSLIFALVLFVAALIVFFDLVQPAYQDLQAAKGKQVSQDNFLANEQKIVSQAQGLVAAFQKQAQNQGPVNMALPVGPNVAGAITQIAGLGSANNIAIQSISVSNQSPSAKPSQPATAGQGGSGQIATAAFGGSLTRPLGSISFQVTATGSYESFKNFLQGLENNTRIFDVKTAGIHQATAAPIVKGAVVTQDNFLYTIVVVAYYQN